MTGLFASSNELVLGQPLQLALLCGYLVLEILFEFLEEVKLTLIFWLLF